MTLISLSDKILITAVIGYTIIAVISITAVIGSVLLFFLFSRL